MVFLITQVSRRASAHLDSHSMHSGNQPFPQFAVRRSLARICSILGPLVCWVFYFSKNLLVLQFSYHKICLYFSFHFKIPIKSRIAVLMELDLFFSFPHMVVCNRSDISNNRKHYIITWKQHIREQSVLSSKWQ